MAVNTNECPSQSPISSPYLPGQQFRMMVKDYVSVLKLGIIMPNLLMAMIGMWLAAVGASGFFSLPLKTIFFSIIGIFMVLASGTSFNNYYDQDIDRLMKRTQERVLALRKISASHVLWLSAALLIAGLTLLMFVSSITAIIALIGWVGYSIIYTIWFKRKHWINTIIGSFSGAVPPVIGWSAAGGHLGWGAAVMFLIMFLWQPPHFYAIAIKRKEEYQKAGIPMLPVVKGFETTKKHMVGSIFLLIPTTLLLYFYTKMNFFYVLISLPLGLGWLLQARWSKSKEHHQSEAVVWAQKNFIYSLIYLVILMVAMFIGSF